jgi:hypothetical protein
MKCYFRQFYYGIKLPGATWGLTLLFQKKNPTLGVCKEKTGKT